jgi:hypothetical protein
MLRGSIRHRFKGKAIRRSPLFQRRKNENRKNSAVLLALEVHLFCSTETNFKPSKFKRKSPLYSTQQKSYISRSYRSWKKEKYE